MNKKINESIKFLISEFNRLNKKNKNNNMSKVEKITLNKLEKYLGKKR